jgi:hypothetical protein
MIKHFNNKIIIIIIIIIVYREIIVVVTPSLECFLGVSLSIENVTKLVLVR